MMRGFVVGDLDCRRAGNVAQLAAALQPAQERLERCEISPAALPGRAGGLRARARSPRAIRGRPSNSNPRRSGRPSRACSKPTAPATAWLRRHGGSRLGAPRARRPHASALANCRGLPCTSLALVLAWEPRQKQDAPCIICRDERRVSVAHLSHPRSVSAVMHGAAGCCEGELAEAARPVGLRPRPQCLRARTVRRTSSG